MKKISLITVCLLLIVLCFSACANSQRLTNLTIVQAIGLDEKDGKVTVTLQYLDVNKGSGTSEGLTGNITACTEGSGGTILKAIENAGDTLPDKLFFDQNKIIVLGSGFEKQHREELIDYMESRRHSRPDVLMAQSTSTAKEIIQNSQKGARVPAESLCEQLKRNDAVFNVNDYLNDYQQNSLPKIRAGKDYTVVIAN